MIRFNHIVLCVSVMTIFAVNGQHGFYIEPSIGYRYAELNSFNEYWLNKNYTEPVFDDIHHGEQMKMAFGYDTEKWLDFAAHFDVSFFKAENFQENLSYEDPMPGGPNFTYSLKSKASFVNYSFGVNVGASLRYFITKEKKPYKWDYQLEFGSSYFWGEYQDDRIVYMWNQMDNSYLSRDSVKYSGFEFSPALAVKWNLNWKWISTVVLRSGGRFSTQPIFTKGFFEAGEYKSIDVPFNFNGFFVSFAIRTYWNRSQ